MLSLFWSKVEEESLCELQKFENYNFCFFFFVLLSNEIIFIVYLGTLFYIIRIQKVWQVEKFMHLKATLTYREFNFNYCDIVQVIQFEKF